MSLNLSRIYAVFAAVLLASTAIAPSVATAQEMAASSRPLVIVRFNQARVYYDQQLYSAISQAVGVKPEVLFDVVSYAPATGDSDVDEKWQKAASAHTQQLVASMQNMGIPLARIRVSGQTKAGLRFDETHVFAR